MKKLIALLLLSTQISYAGINFPLGGVGSTLQFFASSAISTQSSSNTSTSFATFSNSPAFTITPTVSGTYRVWTSAIMSISGANQCEFQITNTSGAATLLYNSAITLTATTGGVTSGHIEAVYSLTAGVTYVFDIQGQVGSVATSITLYGTASPFYMFAQRVL